MKTLTSHVPGKTQNNFRTQRFNRNRTEISYTIKLFSGLVRLSYRNLLFQLIKLFYSIYSVDAWYC